jgi:glycopeptide antibiotics resistance protein
MKKVVVRGALFSLAIELTQWLTGYLAGITFRVADVNDVIFNTLGAAVGYALFAGFALAWRRRSHGWEGNAVVEYVNERVIDIPYPPEAGGVFDEKVCDHVSRDGKP